MTLRHFIVFAALMASGCSRSEVGRGRDCGTVPGGPDDLSAEPAWANDRDFRRWTNENACPVRIDVLTDSFGPSHCGLESVEFITIGEPIGAPAGVNSLDPAARRFIWDPEGALLYANQPSSTTDVREEVLARTSAVDTGYRRGTDELWLDGGDPAVAYVAHGDQVDILQLDVEPLELCS